jgi:putative ABC transport system permease protein
VATALAREVRALDSNLAPSEVVSMREQVSRTTSAQTMAVSLLAVFGGVALVLAAIGLYGVIAFVVGQRRGEIGIRIALGAQRRDILRLVVGRGGRLATVGIGLGILGALGLTRLMSGILFGVRAFDPLTFGAMAAVLWVVAMLASWIPARAAAAVDPIVVLRAE